MKLDPHDPHYPRSLCHLPEPPVLTLSGPLEPNRRVIAIVGSRDAPPAAQAFVHLLAYHLAKADIVIVSGGAKGVDAMAHAGAMKAGGITWCVACTGRGSASYPRDHDVLFETIASSSSSRMIWPFPDGTPVDKTTPRRRNRVLVALAECVIVVQAALRSGSRNAISCARNLGRRIVIAPGTPWDWGYEGSLTECLRGGVDVLWSLHHLFESLHLPAPDLEDPDGRLDATKPLTIQARPVRRRRRQTYSEAPLFPVETDTWSEEEKLVFSRLSMAPIQQDTIIHQTGLPTSSTLTALLTLSLKDVVVEGPDGFFRRRIAL